jgi:hypothetical protein
VNYARISRRFLKIQESLIPLLEAEKEAQLKALDEEINKKIATLPDDIKSGLGTTFIDARYKSLDLLRDQIVLL